MDRIWKKCLALMSAAVLFGSACAKSEESAGEGARDENEEILSLNRQLFEGMIVDKQTALFEEVAISDFRVVAPGGFVENKAQAIAGLAAFEVQSVSLSGEDVVRYNDVAIVTGRLDIDGAMNPVGRWGPLKYMAVYSRNDGAWRLVSRSLTPCLEKVVEMGCC